MTRHHLVFVTCLIIQISLPVNANGKGKYWLVHYTCVTISIIKEIRITTKQSIFVNCRFPCEWYDIHKSHNRLKHPRPQCSCPSRWQWLCTGIYIELCSIRKRYLQTYVHLLTNEKAYFRQINSQILIPANIFKFFQIQHSLFIFRLIWLNGNWWVTKLSNRISTSDDIIVIVDW